METTRIPVMRTGLNQLDDVVGYFENGIVSMAEGYPLTKELIDDVFGNITFEPLEREEDGRIRSFRILSYGPLRLRPERAASRKRESRREGFIGRLTEVTGLNAAELFGRFRFVSPNLGILVQAIWLLLDEQAEIQERLEELEADRKQ
jgi:hypothetical protein